MKKVVKLVGILNVTPDSFSDGGQFLATEQALRQAYRLMDEGADMIDVGGESTRPGAKSISPEQEWNRVKEVVKKLLVMSKQLTVEVDKKADSQKLIADRFQISLDTKNWRTAHKFLSLGGRIINDVSGGIDPRMHETIARFDATVIVNHFPGKSLDEVHEQEINSIDQVRDELLQTKQRLITAGVSPHNIILDPGIGFGKTMELNWELLKFGSVLPDERIYIGYSRKRFLGEARFDVTQNLVAAKRAVEHGAAYLRVHEVGAHSEFLKEYHV